MASPCGSLLFLVILYHLSMIMILAENATSPGVPALIAFGDSIVDPGNNNNIVTLLKCNFPPYGKDFPAQKPTGRFSNGKIPSDFIASALGIKEYLPPYFGATLEDHDLLTGVSFASGGAGYDPETFHFLNIISMQEQLDLFVEYKRRATGILGEEEANRIVNHSLYLVVAGSDDIANNYYLVGSSRRTEYDVPSYVNFLLRSATSFAEHLLDLGARKIAVASAPAIGCVPSQRTIRGGLPRDCAEAENEMAVLFNSALSAELQSLQESYSRSNFYAGTLLTYVDLYHPTLDLFKNSTNYGFEVATRGCCGTGTAEVSFLCNPLTPTCPDASKYVFWDSFHPTEKAFQILADKLIEENRHKFFG